MSRYSQSIRQAEPPQGGARYKRTDHRQSASELLAAQYGHGFDAADTPHGEKAGAKCYSRERCAVECKDDGIIRARLVQNADEQSREPERSDHAQPDAYRSQRHSSIQHKPNDAGALGAEGHA